MSVLIKGMEMPSSCDNCPFCGCYVRDDGTEENYRCCVNMRVLTEFDTVEEHCPLVPVSPHGRLIDVEAPIRFEVTADAKMNHATVDIIAPTVMEAEEAEPFNNLAKPCKAEEN